MSTQHLEPSPYGAAVLAVAEAERILEPDMYVDGNVDHGDPAYRAAHGVPQQRIRGYFVEGVQHAWPKLWDELRAKGQAPPWCAAFASWCLRQAAAKLGRPCPPVAAGVAAYKAALGPGRLVAGYGPGQAGPGDLILWPTHVGLLVDGTADEMWTIEGNTWLHTDQARPTRKVWGIHRRHYNRHEDPERWDGVVYGLPWA